MKRNTVFLVILGALCLISALSNGSVGVNSECINGACNVNVSSSPEGIIMGVGLAIFALIYPQLAGSEDETRVVAIWHRFGALMIDGVALLAATVPIAALPMLFAEAHYMKQFRWSFVRHFERPDDWSNILIPFIIIMAIMIAYFYLHARSGRATLGQYVLGYRIVKASEPGASPSYGLRLFLACFGMCWWPVSIFLALGNRNHAFWWDALSDTRAVRVTENGPPGT